MIGTNESNFPYKLLLTDRKIVIPHRAFTEQSSSTDVKLSRRQMFEINAVWQISWFSYWTVNEILITFH